MAKMTIQIEVTEEVMEMNPDLEGIGVAVGDRIYAVVDTDRPKDPPHNG